MHYLIKTDSKKRTVDAIPFCSDSCHRDYCREHGESYDGWNGCHDGGDSPEFCTQCGVVCGGAYQCHCQRDNVLVNRVPRDSGQKCKHGHWIQVPDRYLVHLRRR